LLPVSVAMARFVCLVAAIVAVCAGCGADTATQERQPDPARQVGRSTEAPAAATEVPENSVDRGIRRNLGLAIARDAELQNRAISFSVTNGDVSVTGIVRTEEERTRINELAMAVEGVKSVANALQVAE